MPDDKFRDIIFKVLVENNIYDRFDTSHDYWDKFKARKIGLEKHLGYFEIESIDNPCQDVITVIPKEYYEHFENFSCNKKRKGQKKGTPRMNFENFANRIATVSQIENFDILQNEYCEQQRFSIVGGEMQKTSIMKTKFSHTNDKRFYYLNGITSLPIGHSLLNNLMNDKKQ